MSFVEKMFLDHGLAIYSKSIKLFKSLLLQFPVAESAGLGGVLVEILIEMMLENKELIRYANSPYYFLEYFLHDVNQCTCTIT